MSFASAKSGVRWLPFVPESETVSLVLPQNAGDGIADRWPHVQVLEHVAHGRVRILGDVTGHRFDGAGRLADRSREVRLRTVGQQRERGAEVGGPRFGCRRVHRLIDGLDLDRVGDRREAVVDEPVRRHLALERTVEVAAELGAAVGV